MKQQIKWLVAALALAALSTPAYAVTADMTGMLSVRGIVTNNLDRNDDIADQGRFVDQRFRLFTNVAANENVKMVFGVEVDNVWGRVGATGKEVGAMGADPKGEIEIKHLYLDFNIPELNANVKAGTQAFNIGRGLILNDDAAGVQASFALSPENTLSLIWVKTAEGDDADFNSDGDYYGAKFAAKLGDVTLAPYAGYYESGNQYPTTASNAYAGFFGVDVDGKAGALTYGLTGVYNDWNQGANDGSGFGILAKAAYQMENTTLSIEAARYGDEDNNGELFSLTQGPATGPLNNFSEIVTGGQYTTNSAHPANVGGAATLYTVNFMYAKLGLAQKLSDKAKISAYVMHIEQAEDTAAGSAITLGQEADAYFDYEIVPGLGLNLAAAYLLADDDFGDDAWKLASSLNYKF